MRISIASDVPTGSGLSSSAALELSIAYALLAHASVAIDSPGEIAKLCQLAEHEFAGMPCGIMDQLVSASGVRGSAALIDCRTETVEHVRLPDADRAVFVLFDSGVKHTNTSGAYALRRAACESASAKLGVRALRDVHDPDAAIADRTLDQSQRQAVRHVVSENRRVLRFRDVLASGRLDLAGECMNMSHRSLSEVYRVSCPELDQLAEICVDTPGTLGARMTGGGFGGWVIALIEAKHQADVVRTVAGRYGSVRGGAPAAHRRVVPSAGARVIPINAG